MAHVIDGLMRSPLKVAITVASGAKLAGVVLGWSPPAYRRDSPRAEDLRLLAWAEHDGFIDETTCEANGAWSFDVPEHYRGADKYWVALATPGLRPDGVPRARDERIRCSPGTSAPSIRRRERRAKVYMTSRHRSERSRISRS